MKNVIELAGDVNEFCNIMVIKLELFQLEQMLDVAEIAGDQVVHRDHMKTFLDEPITQMRTEKSGAARDEYFFSCH